MIAHVKNTIPKGRYKKYHLTRALSLTEIKKLPCKTFSCSKSTLNRFSKKVKIFLKENNYHIIIEKHSGKPLSNNPKNILNAIKLHRQGKSLRNIEKETGIKKSSVHYLIKKAKKTKIKKGKVIITI